MDIPESERPEAAQKKIREVLGVRLFTSAPVDFDPIKASARELLVYGYPARPDEKRHPKLYEHWKQMMSRPVSIIEPQFTVMNKGRGALRYGPPGPPRLPEGDGWAGSVIRPKDDKVSWVNGQWTVPRIVAPTTDHTYICATWVGIDGAYQDPPETAIILQAGTTPLTYYEYIQQPYFVQLFNNDWTQSYRWVWTQSYSSFAWFEWHPAPAVMITNLLVLPGDTMACLICVNTPTEAHIYLRNVTTGQMASWTQTAPEFEFPGSNQKVQLQVVGNTVEWIMEAPVDQDVYLGQFGDVYFDYCWAGTENGALLEAGNVSPKDMYAVNPPPLAIAIKETHSLIKITDP
jgi:hypothetical protein